jgi:hypothetical protein
MASQLTALCTARRRKQLQKGKKTIMGGKVLVCGLLVYALLATCWSANSAGNPTPDTPRFSHPREITNPYLPLASLKQDILESGSERIERTIRPERHRTFQIHHQTVEALTVEDREFKHGQLAEVAFDYVAQADDGTVYYLGEDVDEYRDGKVVSHSGAWLFGRDTLHMGVLMPAHPRVADKFRSEDVSKDLWENDEVVAVAETVIVPAGTFKGCVKIREKLSDGSTEYKLYAAGIGAVKEIESDGAVSLRSHTTIKAAP